MSDSANEKVYYELIIKATCQSTEIWLGDDKGHFVQKETGTLKTSLLPGNYTVEFGLGTGCYPISLTEPRRFTQRELESGPSCPRPEVQFDSYQ